MVRRRSSKAGPAKSKSRPVNRADSKIKKWDKSSDIPLDEEDQFHASRDKILLDRDDFGGDDDGEEDEVFGLQGLSSDEDEDEDQEYTMDLDEHAVQPAKKSKTLKVKSKKNGAISSSSSEESESEEETWGRNKAAYYSSNAAQLESDDEEANELEEQEAKRLQGKAREAMAEDDFGLDDPLEVTGIDVIDDLAEPSPPVIAPLPQDKKLLIRHLEKTSPEALALARDWDDTAQSLMKSREKIAKLESEDPDALSLGMIHLHYQALLTYSSTLAFYLYLRASEKYAQRPELLKSHPILARLLTLKQSLNTLEELDFAPSSDEEDEEEDEEDSEEEDEDVAFEHEEDGSMNEDEIMADAEQLWSLDRDDDLDSDELDHLLHDAKAPMKTNASKKLDDQPPKKKRKTSKPSVPVFDLVEPVFTSSKGFSSNTHADSGMGDAYGEATSLQHADAADKSARKKSLRFHTSKIESASARRQGARTNAAGGDDDIPYRERQKQRDARLAKEAKAKVQGQGGADLDDTEPTEPTGAEKKRRREEDSGDEGEEGADGYYELVKRKTKEKKEQKKATYDAVQAAGRPELDAQGTAGPRSLTRAILANKGLTPRRPKSVRNPRVKKREKFEKAKKKISSQKAVYKGGLETTGKYDGEKSGISKVVKGVRLS